MHGAKFCTKIYANGEKSQVDTTWRAHPPTASYAYQQLSDAVHLLAACIPSAYRLRPGRTYQTAYNR